MNHPVLRFLLYATIIGTLTSAFVVAGASDVPFVDVPFDVNNIPEPVPPPKEVRDFFELDPFYQQWIDVDGFPVLGSTKVSPYALKEAAWLTWQMIGNRRDLVNVFVDQKVHFVLMAHNEVLSDIPEFSPNHVDFLVYNIRGEGGTAVVGHPTPTTGEENVLTSRAYNILIHELGHVVHLFGLTVVDPTFDDRLQRAYDTAMANGLWQGTYAASNSWEYWAEGTHAWFYPRSAGGSFTGDTRQELKTYDPPLSSLLTEVYGDSDWRYTPLAERTHLPHLQGFNPEDAPTFQPSQELVETYQRFHNPNSDGEGKWVDLSPYDPSFLHSLNESRIADSWTMIAFINWTKADILLYWVARDGTARFWKRLPPKRLQWSPTRPGAIYLIKDANGKDITLFQAVEKTGRAFITPTLNLITPGLSKVSGDNQGGISGTVLSNPFVVEVRDQTLTVLEGISVTFTVTAGNGTLSTTRTATDRNGRAESILTLGGNLGTNTVSVSAAGIAGVVTFNAVAEAMADIPDPNLRAAVARAVGKASSASLTTVDMAKLTRLQARNANISNLTGLETATNLTYLNLSYEYVEAENRHVNNNSVSNLSPLSGLTNLTELRLHRNAITDISPVAGLTNLTVLEIGDSNISGISALSGLTRLTRLSLWDNSISDPSPVAALTNLTELNLSGNLLSSIAAVTGLTQLTWLHLQNNSISDIAPLANLTNLTALRLDRNSISDISVLSSLPQLKELRLDHNNITDLSPLVENTGLGAGDEVYVRGNPLNRASIKTHIPALQNRGVRVDFDDVITELVNIPDPNLRTAIENALGKPSGASITTVDMTKLTTLTAHDANISDLTGLESATSLRDLVLGSQDLNPEEPQINSNSVSDLSPLSGLTNLASLNLGGNTISDISPIAGLTDLIFLILVDNNISDITAVAGLTNLKWLLLHNNAITDISPVAGLTDLVILSLRGNPLNYQSIHTHIPTLQSTGVTVGFDPAPEEYTLSIPAGTSLIHVPLKVTTVDGVAKTITTISDLYDALGGASTVNFLITYDSQTQDWRTYFGVSDSGTSADVDLTDDTGVLAGLKIPVSVQLTGEALGIDGNSTMTLHQGLNLVGLPLDNSSITRVSDLFALDGIRGNVPVVILTEGGDFQSVGRAGDPWDIPITGGQGFLLTAQRAATVTISGETWTNEPATASPIAHRNIEERDTTPVLALRGAVVDERTGAHRDDFRVIAKNLSTGRTVTAITSPDEAGYRDWEIPPTEELNEMGYRLIVVDIETGQAATIGDTLEISAQSPDPFIGVKPVRYTVTPEDVRQSFIQLPELIAYEIPKETELLANYPNPFNPETWIPYWLAKDAFVTLTIYDGIGQVIRTLDVGHRIAAVYESRSKAIYWDGRNDLGESVASGVYFYHLQAGDYSATRRMVIVK